jgi:hypothetical protein
MKLQTLFVFTLCVLLLSSTTLLTSAKKFNLKSPRV